MKFSRLRGVKDVFGAETEVWEKISSAARKMFSLYGYSNIITPVIEDVNLFARGIGEGTDIVLKEMYDFKDKGDRHIVMRPEGTASVVRAYIENSLPPKSDLYYYGPMFRYERPQKGRFREFFQIGAESFGDPSPFKDAEVIKLADKALDETPLVKDAQGKAVASAKSDAAAKTALANDFMKSVVQGPFKGQRDKAAKYFGGKVNKTPKQFLDWIGK